MESYEDLLIWWFVNKYEEALPRVTRCARGCVHRAADAIQVVPERMLRNRKTYEPRVFRGEDGDIYIYCWDTKCNQLVPIRLTNYIVGAACNNLKRPKPQPDQLPVNFDATFVPPDEDDVEEEDAEDAARWRFDRLRPCLHRLEKENQLIAMADFYVREYPELQPFFEDYVLTRTGRTYEAVREQWQSTRSDVARRTDRFRGRRQLAPCLLKRGLTDFLWPTNDQTGTHGFPA
jgi:hypothetical protein